MVSLQDIKSLLSKTLTADDSERLTAGAKSLVDVVNESMRRQQQVRAEELRAVLQDRDNAVMQVRFRIFVSPCDVTPYNCKMNGVSEQETRSGSASNAARVDVGCAARWRRGVAGACCKYPQAQTRSSINHHSFGRRQLYLHVHVLDHMKIIFLMSLFSCWAGLSD